MRLIARGVAIGTALGMVCSASGARASLAPSEAEQVRHEVATAQNVGRVRALVARPDLTSSEAAAAMASAMSRTPLDTAHAAFLHELVFGSASAASRPVLAVAVVRGVLARADALLSQRPNDLDRNASALAEIDQAYGLVEDVVAADPRANVTDTARSECARALVEHFAHNPAVLRPDTTVGPAVAAVRAQAAIALLDALPDTPARRVDVADALGLSGPRRATLVELGVLVLDAGGVDGRVSAVRALLDRLPGAADGTEAVVVGDEHVSRLRARGGVVVAIDTPSASPMNETGSPWGNETAPPPVDAATMAVARSLGAAAVRRALERRPQLRAAVDHDGGEAGVATLAAMLAVDAPRTLDAAAARLLIGKPETAAWLSDAVGALAVFAPSGKGPDGLAMPVGHADSGGIGTARATRVALGPAGNATALRVDGHMWRISRDDGGLVTGLSRDSAPVSAKTLGNARPPASEGGSWKGGGLFFARLAGAPRAAVAAGPHVWVYGAGVTDAIATPSPGDDVVVEADVHVDGGPAGVVVRAVPGEVGAFGPFKGVSLLLVPGVRPRAALLVGNGWGLETAAAPVAELASGPIQHVRLVVKGMKVEARVGSVSLEATLPGGFEHGDVALRAYPGATVEATGLKLKKP